MKIPLPTKGRRVKANESANEKASVKGLTLSSFLGSWLLMRPLVLRRNQRDSLRASSSTARRPVARARLVLLCFCPSSIGPANRFSK